MPYYKYDLADIDLSSCDDIVVVPLPIAAVPAIMGTLQALEWRARHISDASHEKGVALYREIQEVFIVNECIVDALLAISGKLDALTSLSCICDQYTLMQEQHSAELETLYRTILQGSENVDATDENFLPNYDQGVVPETYDGDRCQRAQAIFENTVNLSVSWAIININGGVVATGALWALLATLTVISAPISMAISVLLGIASVVYTEVVKTALDDFMSHKQEAVCAIYSATTMADASFAVKQVVDSYVANAYANLLLKGLFHPALMSHFHQNSNNIASFDGDYCLVCVDEFEWEIVVPCVEDDWWVGSGTCCEDGYPTCSPSKALIRHTGGTLVIPAGVGNRRYSVRLEGVGGSGPNYTTIKLYHPSDGYQQTLYTNYPVPVGSYVDVEGTFSTTRAGQVAQLQINNSPYFVRVHKYGLAPPE